MSDFNIAWLKENLHGDENIIIFDFGCADLSDSIRFRRYLPQSQIYSFECNPRFQKKNRQLSQTYKIKYHDCAISDKTGEFLFWPCRASSTDVDRYAGTLVRPDQRSTKSWQDPVLVKTVSLNDFCAANHVRPDVIHIDVEGMELPILKSLQEEFLPKIIWAENPDHKKLMQDTVASRGFNFFDDGYDTLFWCKELTVLPYRSIRWEHDDLIDYNLAEKEFLDAYRGRKSQSWPAIQSFNDFLKLPESIKTECFENLFIDPVLKNHNINERQKNC